MQLEIGNSIKIIPRIGSPWVSTIIRVTKTKAIGDHPTNKKYFPEFRREYRDDWITPFKSERWDTTERRLIKM